MPGDTRLIGEDADKKTRGMPLEMLLLFAVGLVALFGLASLGRTILLDSGEAQTELEEVTGTLGASSF